MFNHVVVLIDGYAQIHIAMTVSELTLSNQRFGVPRALVRLATVVAD